MFETEKEVHPLIALHTMARRHCLERFAFWTERYRRFQAGEDAPIAGEKENATQQADSIFPRYLAWQAMLAEIERADLSLTRTIDDLRTDLIAAAWRAQTAMTSNPALSMVARFSMNEERANFERTIKSVSEGDLERVEPLESRRVFSEEELRQVWERLSAVWNVTDDYWWPLRKGNAPITVVAFHTDWFDGEKIAYLRKLLTAKGIEQAWEVREFRKWGCERPISSLIPQYTGEEGYWTSKSMDWLVYASHESSVTLAGEWLIRGFYKQFRGCERQNYQGPMSTTNRRGTWQFCRSL